MQGVQERKNRNDKSKYEISAVSQPLQAKEEFWFDIKDYSGFATLWRGASAGAGKGGAAAIVAAALFKGVNRPTCSSMQIEPGIWKLTAALQRKTKFRRNNSVQSVSDKDAQGL